MKRFIVVTIMLAIIPIHSIRAQQSDYSCIPEFRVFADVACIDALWSKHISLECGIGVSLAPGIEVEIPVTYMLDRSGGKEQLFEFILSLKYYPWESGPFIACSMAHVCMFVGPYKPLEKFHCLNELHFGYTATWFAPFIIEASLSLRDPSDTFTDSRAYIAALVPGYSRFRFHLRAGYRFSFDKSR